MRSLAVEIQRNNVYNVIFMRLNILSPQMIIDCSYETTPPPPPQIKQRELNLSPSTVS